VRVRNGLAISFGTAFDVLFTSAPTADRTINIPDRSGQMMLFGGASLSNTNFPLVSITSVPYTTVVTSPALTVIAGQLVGVSFKATFLQQTTVGTTSFNLLSSGVAGRWLHSNSTNFENDLRVSNNTNFSGSETGTFFFLTTAAGSLSFSLQAVNDVSAASVSGGDATIGVFSFGGS
jgi:hypothetical protein